MHDYSYQWDLTINVSITKVMIFLEERFGAKLFFNGEEIETVFDFKYLVVKFNYNGKFNVAQNDLYNRATKAMFVLMKKIRKLLLPIDIQIDLFDKTMIPIMLYGSEIWYPQMSDMMCKLQLRFYKNDFESQ